MESYEATLTTIKYFLAGVMGLVVFFFVLLPLIRGLKEPLDYPELHRELPGLKKTSIVEPDIEVAIPQEDKKNLQDKEIIDLAKKDPVKTASIIRKWLSKVN